MRTALLAAVLAAGTCAAQSQSVALQGMLGSKALLMVDGGPPKAVAPGETHQGVKVLSTTREQAVVDIGGQRRTLQLGEAPASFGGAGNAPPAATRIVLTADRGGHFLSDGTINGRQAQFLVDTGATTVALGA
ncbi:MAG TPA: TIGR02281 family clan AA aspartic protease, partial [Ramlibacter sp.]|nr:TIGR02281 family clan AA aspartic protease [Ramlibacter sp.]